MDLGAPGSTTCDETAILASRDIHSVNRSIAIPTELLYGMGSSGLNLSVTSSESLSGSPYTVFRKVQG